jgi:hypothetical protein
MSFSSRLLVFFAHVAFLVFFILSAAETSVGQGALCQNVEIGSHRSPVRVDHMWD